MREALVDLRYLPFLWIVASAVASEEGRRRTFGGLAVIVGVWTLDALLEAASGTSPLFWRSTRRGDQRPWHVHRRKWVALDRLVACSGRATLLGIVLASPSPFALDAA